MNVTGNDIKMMRECSGKTALEIATSLGMESSLDYDRWENDNDDDLPSMNEFLVLCMVCGFNPAELIKTMVDKDRSLDLSDFREIHGQKV